MLIISSRNIIHLVATLQQIYEFFLIKRLFITNFLEIYIPPGSSPIHSTYPKQTRGCVKIYHFLHTLSRCVKMIIFHAPLAISLLNAALISVIAYAVSYLAGGENNLYLFATGTLHISYDETYSQSHHLLCA